MFLARNTHGGSMAAYHYHRLLLDHSDITAPPTNKTNTSYNADANFDGNMMIILAALLCALLCAVALNSIVRCFLRCTSSPGGDTAAVASTGVKKAALSWIPVVAYEAGPPTDCPICLGELIGGEDVRFFPICNHAFHVKCIDMWLLLHSSCPTCRQPLIQHSSISSADHVIIQIN